MIFSFQNPFILILFLTFEKTNQIASVIQPDKEDYNWKSLNYNTPNKNDLIIYEMLVRDFVEDHHYLTLLIRLTIFRILVLMQLN